MPTSSTVGSDDDIYRRIRHTGLREDGSVSSSAFKGRDKKPLRIFCGDLARLSTPERTQMRPGAGPQFGVIEFAAGVAISLGFQAIHEADEADPTNDAHVTFKGESSKSICSDLAGASIVRIYPARRQSDTL